MSIEGLGETNSNVNQGRTDRGFLIRLRAVALIAAVVGAVGSVGLMFRVGQRNPSRLLLGLFAIWVLSPFIALLLANMITRRWSVLTQVTLHSLTLILTLGSLALYGDVAWRPRPQPAFVFLVVPLGSWLLLVIAVPLAAFISGRLSRRDA